MARVSYTAPEVRTINEARLLELHISRDVDTDGVLSGLVTVMGVAQIGHFDGAAFTEHRRIRFAETRPLAAVAAFFGAGLLNTLEQKVLERGQATGSLPAGAIG